MMKRIVALIAFVFASSCATQIKPIEPANFSNTEIDTSGIILTLNFSMEEDAPVREECKLKFKNRDSKQVLELALKPGEIQQLMAMPPGNYVTYSIECGDRYAWMLLENKWGQFKVAPGLVSVIAPTEVKIFANMRISSRLPKRAAQHKSVEAVWINMTEGQRAKLVSGYTLQPITAEMFKLNPQSTSVVAKLANGERHPIKDRSFIALRECYENEDQTNPLWIGEPTMKVDLKGGKVNAVDITNGTHSFTQNFLNCAKTKAEAMEAGKLPPKTVELSIIL